MSVQQTCTACVSDSTAQGLLCSTTPYNSLTCICLQCCNPARVSRHVTHTYTTPHNRSATGFVFQLHPADSRLTPATPLGTPASANTPRSTRRRRGRTSTAAAGGSAESSEETDEDEEEEEEELTFVPISLGSAEGSMPDFLKVRGWLCVFVWVGAEVVVFETQEERKWLVESGT